MYSVNAFFDVLKKNGIMGKRLYSIPDAAAEIDISDKTLRVMLSKGIIKYVLVGRRRKVPAEEIERIQREGTHPCPSTGGAMSTITNSSSRVYDFAAARAKRKEKRPRP
ncbi:MAG: helix-turn-helix domain-containing protein [Alphaproteobacteria bacterium]|nr:helix-turn-helix domain-containing protein [Alphaproteobacteria bacterium]